jgi:very-short-patch-repair endonuclease
MDAGGVWRYTDAEFTMRDGRTLIVEIDGLHHLEPTNWLNDIDRQNDLVLSVDGLVLRVATWTLNRQPAPFMAKIAALL